MPDRRAAILHAVGDIALGDHPLCTGFGTHSRGRGKPPAFPFEHVSAILAGADIRFGNLECTLSERGLRRHDYHSVQMRGHAQYVAGLAETGFDVLNVANNHSMQHGPEPFEDTVGMLKRAGIGVCGISQREGCAAVVATACDLRVAFLGYSLRPRQYFTERPLYAEGSLQGIVADVRAARSTCDILVVSLHWGDEFVDRPSPDDVHLAHAIVDAGADLIVGHHPHVLRGVERYGRGWIAYSLGNFVCDMVWGEELRETAICECRLTAAGVEDVRLIPVRINDACQPVPLSGVAATRLEQRLAALSTALVRPEAASTAAAAEYETAAYRAHSGQRGRSHRYFLKNAYRFPAHILAAQVTTYLRNRLAERGWMARC
jgi:gamma-polyglutamate biosynthesis protein CapA